LSQLFKFNKGEITFEQDKILIADDAGRQLRRTRITSGIWAFYGTLSVLRFIKTGDQFLLWSGLIIGLGHLAILFTTLFRSEQNEIYVTDVHTITLKKRFGNSFLDIRLKSNRIRRVLQVEETEDLKKYIQEHFS